MRSRPATSALSVGRRSCIGRREGQPAAVAAPDCAGWSRPRRSCAGGLPQYTAEAGLVQARVVETCADVTKSRLPSGVNHEIR